MSKSQGYPINLINALEIKCLPRSIKDENVVGILYSVSTLPSDELYIIEAFFKYGKTLDEIATDMKIKRNRVAEIGDKALNRLRNPSRSKYIVGRSCILSDLARASLELKYAEYEKRETEKLDRIIRGKRQLLEELNRRIEKINNSFDKISNMFGIDIVELENIIFDAKDYVNGCTNHKLKSANTTNELDNKFPENLASTIVGTEKMDKLDAEQVKGLEFLLSRLSDYEKHIILKRYKDRSTLENIGKHLGISRERVRQIEINILRKLRCKNGASYILKGYSITRGNEEITEYEHSEIIKEKNIQRIKEFNEIVSKLENHRKIIMSLCGDKYELIMNEAYKMEELIKNSPFNVKLRELFNAGRMSARTYHCLQMYLCKHGCDIKNTSLMDVANVPREEIMGIRGLGVASLKELEGILNDYGLILAE